MRKKYGSEAQSASGRKTLAIIFAALIITVAITNFLPADPIDYGFMSVLPALFLIVYIFATRRILEALILASILGFIMVSRPETMGNNESWLANTFTNFSDVITGVKVTDTANTTPVAVDWTSGAELVNASAIKIKATSAMGISSTDGVATYNITLKMGYNATTYIINASGAEVAVTDMTVKADNIAQENTYTIKLAESDIANNAINVVFVIAKNAD